jgi:hypothetical protein
VKESIGNGQGPSRENAGKLEKNAAQLESERLANESRTNAQSRALIKARESEKKAAQLEAEQREKEARKKAQSELKLRGKGKPAAVVKGGTNTVDRAGEKKAKK